jgi:bile acid:Na+ symporter, BASS family
LLIDGRQLRGETLTIITRLLTNRNFILIFGFALGLALGDLAEWTESLTLPVLALVMTVSTTQVSTAAFTPLKNLVRPMSLAIVLSFLALSGTMLVLARWLMPNQESWMGFVVIAAMPPGVAIIPFTDILEGDTTFSLIGEVGAYMAALLIAPAMLLLLAGDTAFDPMRLMAIMVELIVIPVVLSRVLRRVGLAPHVEKWGDLIMSWGFFIVIFTVVGLNREVFFRQPEVVALSSLVGLLSIFGLRYTLEYLLKWRGVEREQRVSLILLGTVKNTGVAAVVALALFGRPASVPAVIVGVFNLLHLLWLSARSDRI